MITDENLRLIEDEVKGIIETGTGWCFYKHQLEAIKEKLKEKLSPEIFKSFNYMVYKCKTLSLISCVLPWFQNWLPI